MRAGDARAEQELLTWFRGHGAEHLGEVRLRDNRSTIWSLTKGGRCLNLHRAFAEAPESVLCHFVVITREAHRRTATYRRSAAAVRNWAPLRTAMTDPRRRRSARSPMGRGRCCGTGPQREYLRTMYRWFNETRFDARLPDDLALRWSNRMRSRLGQMVSTVRDERPVVVEIALNVDLLLPRNAEVRRDTLAHEMAHAAAWLFDRHALHGRPWKAWAVTAGCAPRACTTAPIARRARGARTVTCVPEVPRAALTALTE